MSKYQLVENEKQRVIEHIEKFKEKNKNKNKNKKKNKEFQKSEEAKNSDDINIISIIADRGFGKTTILNEVRNEMEKTKEVYFLDPITPLHINETNSTSHGILELIISYLYMDMKNFMEINEATKRRRYADIQKIIDEVLNPGISETDRLEASLAILNKIIQKKNVNKNIERIIDDLLDDYNKEILVISIDDLDLFDKDILQKILKDITAFFNIDNIVFLTAYNEANLKEKYIENKLKENEKLLKENFINKDVIYAQVYAELNKIFIPQTKIYLPLIGEVYQKQAKDLWNDLNDNDKDLSIKEYLLKSHQEICPVNSIPYLSTEDNSVLLPNSIRGILQFKEDITRFAKINNDSKQDEENFGNQEVIITEYQNWFLNLVSLKINKYEYKQFLNELEQAENKNAYIVKNIRRFVQNNFKNQLNVKKILLNDNARDYANIALGDVVYTLNAYYDIDNSQDTINFIYAIKMYLSMEMKKALSKYNSNNEIWFTEYQKIAIGYPTPLNRTYTDVRWKPIFDKNDLLNKSIFEQEKIILMKNMVTSYNLGQKVYQNSSFILEYLESNNYAQAITTESRKENLLPLYTVSNINHVKSKGSSEEKINNVKDYLKEFEEIIKINIGTSIDYEFLIHPFKFLITKEYIDWAIKDKQFVVWDVFTLDYLFDLNTQRSTEEKPLHRIYLRMDSGIKGVNKNELTNNFKILDNHLKVIDNSQIAEWWSGEWKKYDIGEEDPSNPSQRYSITRTDYDEQLKMIALYTRYEKTLVLRNITQETNEKINQLYQLIIDWKQPRKKVTSANNPETIIGLIEEHDLEDNEFFKQEFKEKFIYDINNFEKENDFYTGTEIGEMRNFVRNFKKNFLGDNND